jgi:hypothetical protein
MRPLRREVFRSDAASRLDDIELITALLERDATNGRSFTTERGLALPPLRRRRKYPKIRRAVVASGASLSDARRLAGGGLRHAVLHPRLLSGARAAAQFIIDVLIMLALAAGALAVVVAGYLVAAPPF